MDTNKVRATFADAKEVCGLLGISSRNPQNLLRMWMVRYGFPRGSKVGRRREWKVSEVLAWRENQHAMAK